MGLSASENHSGEVAGRPGSSSASAVICPAAPERGWVLPRASLSLPAHEELTPCSLGFPSSRLHLCRAPGFLEDPDLEVPGVNPLLLGSGSWAGLGLCFLHLCALEQKQVGAGVTDQFGAL